MKEFLSGPFTALATLAVILSGCTTPAPQQPMEITSNNLSTPSHALAHADYPFDDGGHYVDAWAAEGARRYPSSLDSDSTDEGRPARRKTSSRTAKPKPASRTAATRAKSKGVTITIKSGDTLHGLSQKYGTSVAAIKKANGLTSDLLRDGRKLVIPR